MDGRSPELTMAADETKTARAMWKGVLRFGSVAVPVKLYAAVQERSVRFHLLHDQDHERVRQRMANPMTDETVPPEQVRRGFEVEEGVYVVLEDEDLATLEPAESRDIVIYEFLPAAAVSPAFYERAYFLGPDDGAAADYAACVTALLKSGRIGFARWVMRKKEYMGVLRAEAGRGAKNAADQGADSNAAAADSNAADQGTDSAERRAAGGATGGYLMLVTLRHLEEVVPISALPTPEGRALDEKELAMAEQLVCALEGPFEPEQYHDEYRARVMELIESKAAGKKVKLTKPAPKQPPPESLTDVLAASLKAVGRNGHGNGDTPTGSARKNGEDTDGRTGRRRTAGVTWRSANLSNARAVPPAVALRASRPSAAAAAPRPRRSRAACPRR